MTASATIVSIKTHLCDLQMPGSLEAVDRLMEQLDHGSLGPAEAMEQLLAAQVELRRQRRLASAMSSSQPELRQLPR